MIQKNNQKIQINIKDLCHFTEKQMEAHYAVKKYKYVLYGGALGGGKSYFLRWELLWQLLEFAVRGHTGVKVGLFCNDFTELKDRHLSKIRFEFPEWLGDFKETDHDFILKPEYGSGILSFRNLDDVTKYQSSEFAIIAIDELTRTKEDEFNFLRTRLRTAGITKTRFIGATNPDGNGRLWVKRLWIDQKFSAGEKYADQFKYIPAKLSDNPHLNSEDYLKELESLPEERRKALLEGSWEIFAGQFFAEWDPKVHVVPPFDIPLSWTRYRSIDIAGQNGTTSCHWYAVDSLGTVWIYLEYYATGYDYDQNADHIRQLSKNEHYAYTVIDSSAFAKQGFGETAAQVYERHGVIDLIPSPKERIPGWDSVHRYLRIDKKTGQPKLKVFNTCANMIRTLPSLIYDKNNNQDVDTKGEDHAADELRYLLHTLRDQKSPRPLNLTQRRIVEFRRQLGLDPYQGIFDDDSEWD